MLFLRVSVKQIFYSRMSFYDVNLSGIKIDEKLVFTCNNIALQRYKEA